MTRWPWQSLLGRDDVTTLVATILAVSQAILAMRAAVVGVGRASDDLSQTTVLTAEKLYYTSDTFFILTGFTSRLAAAFFLYRLSSAASHKLYAIIIAAMCVVFGIASVLVVAIRPNVMKPWVIVPTLAKSTLDRWVVYTVLSNLIDFLVVAFSAHLVWNLQMKGSKKWAVVCAFGVRLLGLIPISIVRLVVLNRALKSDDFLFSAVGPEVLTQIEMCYAVLSATIPCLRIFLSAAQTGLLNLEATDKATGYYGNGSHSKPLSRSRKNRSATQRSGGSIELATRKHGETISKITRVGGDARSMESDSSERAIMVRQTIDIKIDDDDGR
ncbi:hypothetical protein LTR62_001613 [Meristemomyces frigidus]|uniref:Rhodopsin domain-containing protein n=1 Tax=Meristemomyces frigidus TaxID=1508187 RepID=A0AAN7T963_9PEZI|nr:hypothetical protein LTR62_001613 [Meristemomyces frigidus]